METETCGAHYITLGYVVLWCDLPKGHDLPHADSFGNSWNMSNEGFSAFVED